MNFSKSVGIGLLSFVGFVLLFGIPTALIPTPLFSRMTPSRSLDYLFLLLNSGLLGIYVGLSAYEKHAKSKEGTLATSGSIFNILAVVALLGYLCWRWLHKLNKPSF